MQPIKTDTQLNSIIAAAAVDIAKSVRTLPDNQTMVLQSDLMRGSVMEISSALNKGTEQLVNAIEMSIDLNSGAIVEAIGAQTEAIKAQTEVMKSLLEVLSVKG